MLPNAGDIAWVDFSPVTGTEQSGTRPALIVSDRGMHEMTRRAVICPITRNVQPWPTKILLPKGLAAEGAVLVDQIHSIDRNERILRMIGQVPPSFLTMVRRKVAALLGIDFAATPSGTAEI
jgi:mRNA interferase MazF